MMVHGSRGQGAGLHICEVVGDRVQLKRRSISQDGGGRRARRTRTKAVVTTNGGADVAHRMRGWSGEIAGGENMFKKRLVRAYSKQQERYLQGKTL
jgi:hypothetical protein